MTETSMYPQNIVAKLRAWADSVDIENLNSNELWCLNKLKSELLLVLKDQKNTEFHLSMVSKMMAEGNLLDKPRRRQ
jgi:hypothetical protein